MIYSFNHPYLSISFTQSPQPTIRITSHNMKVDTLLGVYKGVITNGNFYRRDGFIRYESHLNILRFITYQDDGVENAFLIIPQFVISKYLEAQMSLLFIPIIFRFSVMLEVVYEASVTYLDPHVIIKAFEFQLPAISQQHTFIETSTTEAVARMNES